VGLAAALLMRGDFSPSSFLSPIARDSNILSHVPGHFDQMIYIDMDDELITTLMKSQPNQYGENFQQLAERVDIALIIQYAT
jgi:hypothetical protein